MLLKLIALFTIVSLTELFLLMKLAELTSVGLTIGIVVLTCIVGGTLARREGLRAWQRIVQELAAGRLPGDALIDGMIILVGGALLVTPGILTDLVGLATLIPQTRALIRGQLKKRFSSSLRLQTFPFGAPTKKDPEAQVRDTDDWEDA
jgi:UPF0716 protein FxsA